MIYEAIENGPDISTDGHVTFGDGNNILEKLLAVDQLINDNESFKKRLSTFERKQSLLDEIRLRAVLFKLRDTPELRGSLAVWSSEINPGNRIAHEGRVEVDVVVDAISDELFRHAYGIERAFVRRNTQNFIVLAMLNLRFTHFDGLKNVEEFELVFKTAITNGKLDKNGYEAMRNGNFNVKGQILNALLDAEILRLTVLSSKDK